MKIPEIKKMNEQVHDADARRMINKLIDIISEMNKEIEVLKNKKQEIVYVNSDNRFCL